MSKRSLSICSMYLLTILPLSIFSCEEDTQRVMNEESRSRAQHQGQTPFGTKSCRSSHTEKAFCCFPAARPEPHHFITAYSSDARVLEIEDGSRWKLSSSHTLRYWRTNDTIAITPNHCTSSDYNYYLTNKSTGGYVEANLILGPVAFGPMTHWAMGFNLEKNQVSLEDNSSWKVADDDGFILEEWEANDTIIIGSNDSWFSTYDTILINVNMNNYVRAKSL